MPIVLSSPQAATRPQRQEIPPVPGAVRLTPLQMNMLHFGSDKNTPVAAGKQA